MGKKKTKNKEQKTKWLATSSKSHSVAVHAKGRLVGKACFLHRGQLTWKSQHYDCDNKEKKFPTRMKYSILKNIGFYYTRQLENVHILTNLYKPQETFYGTVIPP